MGQWDFGLDTCLAMLDITRPPEMDCELMTDVIIAGIGQTPVGEHWGYHALTGCESHAGSH